MPTPDYIAFLSKHRHVPHDELSTRLALQGSSPEEIASIEHELKTHGSFVTESGGKKLWMHIRIDPVREKRKKP